MAIRNLVFALAARTLIELLTRDFMGAPKREKGSAAFERFLKLTKRVISIPQTGLYGASR